MNDDLSNDPPSAPSVEPPPAPMTIIHAAEYASRIRALLRRGGISNGFPRRAADRWILLHAIARAFRPGERLTEIEATQRIGAFLMSSAPHWRMDRVNVRRALVDDGFIDRDPNGTDYRVSRRFEQRVRFEDVPEMDALLEALRDRESNPS